MQETNVGLYVGSLPGAEEVGKFEHSYLVCHLDDRLFGLPTREVQEIIPLPPLMSLPQLPECMLGLARYRDDVIPVLDLRRVFADQFTRYTDTDQMVVINQGSRLCGVALHDISEIMNFSSRDIEPMPSLTTDEGDEFYVGIKRMSERLVTLLDLGSILDFAQIATRSSNFVSQFATASADLDRVSIIRLGDIRVGIDIKQIERIGKVPEIKGIEDAPSCVMGIALRDGIDVGSAAETDFYPIVDLFTVMDAPEDNGKRSLILSASSGVTVGFYAGQVDTIMELPATSIVDIPKIARTSGNQFVKNIIKTAEDLVLLLDLPGILLAHNLTQN